MIFCQTEGASPSIERPETAAMFDAIGAGDDDAKPRSLGVPESTGLDKIPGKENLMRFIEFAGPKAYTLPRDNASDFVR
jgi:hypothetical protein